jgi:transcriptional regulator
MFNPPAFRESRVDVMHALMRRFPLATLITQGAHGPEASPLPFLLDAGRGEHGMLRAHLARANPHWQSIAGGDDRCLVVFQGPQAYITPSWYASKAEHHRVVPTWNYATVHVRGHIRVIDEAAWLHQQVADLTRAQEAGRPVPWAASDAPQAYRDGLVQGLVGLEVTITQIEGKWKMSQNRPAADQAGVVAGLGDHADPHRAPDVADLVAQWVAARPVTD